MNLIGADDVHEQRRGAVLRKECGAIHQFDLDVTPDAAIRICAAEKIDGIGQGLGVVLRMSAEHS